jgi:hypothetical protein
MQTGSSLHLLDEGVARHNSKPVRHVVPFHAKALMLSSPFALSCLVALLCLDCEFSGEFERLRETLVGVRRTHFQVEFSGEQLRPALQKGFRLTMKGFGKLHLTAKVEQLRPEPRLRVSIHPFRRMLAESSSKLLQAANGTL